jgi:hypothetical protein
LVIYNISSEKKLKILDGFLFGAPFVLFLYRFKINEM